MSRRGQAVKGLDVMLTRNKLAATFEAPAERDRLVIALLGKMAPWAKPVPQAIVNRVQPQSFPDWVWTHVYNLTDALTGLSDPQHDPLTVLARAQTIAKVARSVSDPRYQNLSSRQRGVYGGVVVTARSLVNPTILTDVVMQELTRHQSRWRKVSTLLVRRLVVKPVIYEAIQETLERKRLHYWDAASRGPGPLAFS